MFYLRIESVIVNVRIVKRSNGRQWCCAHRRLLYMFVINKWIRRIKITMTRRIVVEIK